MIEVDATVPAVARMRTGLYGLDVALGADGDLGFPLRSITELYGKQGVGKSSLAYYLAGKRDSSGTVVICDLERTADIPFILSNLTSSGFDGKLSVIKEKDEKKKGLRTHESMLKEAIDSLWKDERTMAVIVDSIGSMAPIAEMEADFGEAQLGRRAFVMAQAARRSVAWLRNAEPEKILLYINHVQTPIGGRGHITPGGDTLKYLCTARLMMYRDEGFDDGSFITQFSVERLKYGGTAKERKGYIFVIPEFGLSPEMTAVIDCCLLGLAERGNTVKLKKGDKDQSFGYISKLIEMAKDPEQRGKFKPFFDALAAYEAKGE